MVQASSFKFLCLFANLGNALKGLQDGSGPSSKTIGAVNDLMAESGKLVDVNNPAVFSAEWSAEFYSKFSAWSDLFPVLDQWVLYTEEELKAVAQKKCLDHNSLQEVESVIQHTFIGLRNAFGDCGSFAESLANSEYLEAVPDLGRRVWFTIPNPNCTPQTLRFVHQCLTNSKTKREDLESGSFHSLTDMQGNLPTVADAVSALSQALELHGFADAWAYLTALDDVKEDFGAFRDVQSEERDPVKRVVYEINRGKSSFEEQKGAIDMLLRDKKYGALQVHDEQVSVFGTLPKVPRNQLGTVAADFQRVFSQLDEKLATYWRLFEDYKRLGAAQDASKLLEGQETRQTVLKEVIDGNDDFIKFFSEVEGGDIRRMMDMVAEIRTLLKGQPNAT